jgi:hypothetical protein
MGIVNQFNKRNAQSYPDPMHNPTWIESNELQGVSNPGGRGTVLENSFIAPDGNEWVKVGWPDDTITYEDVENVEVGDERTEGTERPLEYYVNKFGPNPKINAESIGGNYPPWLGEVDSTQTAAPSGPTQDQISDRIYDITIKQQPEAQSGELQGLLDQWKQMTGRDKPRFLEGIKNPFVKLAKLANKFKVGDKVISTATGNDGVIEHVSFDKPSGLWFYSVRWKSGPNAHGVSPVMENGLKDVGGQVPNSKFKIGDSVEYMNHLTGKTEQDFISDARYDAKLGEWTYEIDNNKNTGYFEHNLKPAKSSGNQNTKRSFKPGDQVRFYHRGGSINGIIQATVESVIGPEDKNYAGWLYVFFDDNGKKVHTRVHPDRVDLMSGNMSSTYEDGDRVRVLVDGRSSRQEATVVSQYPKEEDGTEWFVIQYDDGNEEVIDGNSLELVEARKDRTKPQQRQDYDYRPEETNRKDFHPSQQDLMSHIKDTGTPYFPPTPQGYKDFEEYLSKQYNAEFEQMKKTWGQLIRKLGKKGKMLVAKQRDELYAAAMARHQ